MDLFDSDKEQRISDLTLLIKKYQDSYYNGEAEISDAEFDSLWDELKKLDPKNAILKKVGADSGNFQKTRHRMPMGSQEKAANGDEFLKWAKNHDYEEYLVEYKLDGASLELQYDGGDFVRAVTRGDGTIGDDISQNARKMSGVLPALFDSDGKKIDFTGAVRGEVIMTKAVHAQFYATKANCRNAANGIMKRKDGKGAENLRLIVYDALSTNQNSFFSDEEEKIDWLKSCGFNTVPLVIKKNAQEVIEYREEIDKKRVSLEYDIDGLVIKERKINMEDAWRNRPDRQIAFKFSLEKATTILREVEWSESGATYTPVGIFDSVQLNGTTVSRASLANPDTIRNLNLKIGSRIVVVKRGEIIPKIEEAQDGDGEMHDVDFPKTCETCGAMLVDEGTRLFCPNEHCSKRVLHRIQKWISVVDIRDFGDTLVRSLFADKKINSILDIYSLSQNDFVPYFLNEESISDGKDSLGAKKVYDSIHARKRLSLATFVAGFDIEGVGETVVQKLVDAGFDTLEKLFDATADDFLNVKGFAQIMANTVVDGLSENRAEMEKLVFEKIIEIETVQKKDNAIFGKSFCFTGELKSMKRADAESLVKENGGSCKSSVTKDLSFLVTNDKNSGSAKNEKAKKYKIPIIDENDFLALLKGKM